MVKPPAPSRGVVGPSRNTLPRSRPSHPELSKQKTVIVDEEDTALPARRANPSSNAFSGRYDFSASLSAAKKAINAGQQTKSRSSPSLNAENRHSTGSYFDFAPRGPKAQQASSSPKNDAKLDELKLHKPSIESPSYQELINNYCFAASSKTAIKPDKKTGTASPPQRVTLAGGPEKAPSPQYSFTAITQSPPALIMAPHASPGNSSPIPVNHAGFRHRRQGSGAFRFEQQKASTAIC